MNKVTATVTRNYTECMYDLYKTENELDMVLMKEKIMSFSLILGLRTPQWQVVRVA